MIEKPLIAVLIPTYYSQTLKGLLDSLAMTVPRSLCHLYILNNGGPGAFSQFYMGEVGEVLECGTNLGWEGALSLGIQRTEEPFVMFLNDDVHIPPNNLDWLPKMLSFFRFPNVGAVGPMSNIIMGQQNLFYGDWTYQVKSVQYLIGMMMLLRRSALVGVGGIDCSLPGGDDLDLSIRLRQAGYQLLVTRDVYVHHHAFQTGPRVYKEYWNSEEMQEKTNMALIKKHGVKAWFECLQGAFEPWTPFLAGPEYQEEQEVVRAWVTQEPVLEIGCGGELTVPNSVGVDMVPKGELIATIGKRSVATIVANVEEDLPVPDESQGTIIARHILEHCVNPVDVLRSWKRKLKVGGRLIVAVPDERLQRTIPMNPEHVHAFTPEFLGEVVAAAGLTWTALRENFNRVSFVAVLDHGLPKPPKLPFLAAEPKELSCQS